MVEGRTIDDAGKPVPSHPIRVFVRQDNALMTFGGATACAPASGGRGPPSSLEVKEGALYFSSDEGGRFCVEVPLAVASYEVVVQGISTELVAGAETKLTVDLSKRALRLRFDPEPHILALDTFSGTLEALAEIDDDQPAPAVNVPLELKTEAGVVIARASTQAGGRAAFQASSASLGGPGRGELVVAFPGDADTMPSTYAAPVERRALVTLVPPTTPVRGTPEDGVAFDVAVQTKFGNAPSGTVEATLGGVTVGAASVVLGRASMLATFATPLLGSGTRSSGAGSTALTLRYVPDEPYYVPSSVAVVGIEVQSPSPLRQAPLLLGALAIAAWILAGRAARKRKTMAPPPVEPSRPNEGSPRIEVIAPSKPGVRRWAGRVLDAHDGTLLEGVRVAVERPGFDGKLTLASTFTEKNGRFVIEEIATSEAPGAILVAEGPLHSAFERPLPEPGMLEIALVSRKRRLLDRLVDWARRKGPPFSSEGAGRAEPTPMHVRRAAGADQATAEWAKSVEQAVFDDVAVDSRVEREVQDLEPPLKGR